MNLKSIILIIILIIALLIAFPFFYINYFESTPIINLLIYYINLIFFLALTISIILYFIFLNKFNLKTSSAFKKILQHISTIIVITVVVFMIIYGLLFSLTVTGNAFLGTPKSIHINEKVTKSETYITKNGRLRYYIYFKKPKTNYNVRLEVYKKYNVGEYFAKEMQIGKFGYLFSIDK